MATVVRTIALVVLLTIGACKGSGDETGDATPAAAPAPYSRIDPTPAVGRAAGEDPTGPLVWLDPNANGVAWVDLPATLSPMALSAVYALPPRASALLQAPHAVDDALVAITGRDALPTEWFSGAALVSTSMLTSGPYVIRKLARPRGEITAALADTGFHATTTEGFEIWQPRGAFPWKVVMLDEITVAFVPVREPGSGLTPLTAGRDMPPSDLEREISGLTREDASLRVALFAAGPMLHFDVEPSLLGARLELRSSGGRGLDGQVLFEPQSDPDGVAAALGKRKIPEETDQIQLLAEEVAYQVDGGIVLGRLQIPASRIAAVEDTP